MVPTDDRLFFTSLDLLNQAITSVTSLAPSRPRTLPILEFTPVRMFWQTVTRSQAIHHLLTEGFISEAAIILRSLMFDAHHLMYLNEHPAKRNALVLSLREQEIHNWKDLATIACEAKIDNDIQPILEKAREEHQRVQRTMKRLGVSKLAKFPGQGASMARSLGRVSDIVGHKMYSLMVHSTALNPVGIGVKKIRDGEIVLHLRDKNPALVYGVAHSAAELLFEASIAIANWQAWSTLEDIKAKYENADAAFKDLGPKGSSGARR